MVALRLPNSKGDGAAEALPEEAAEYLNHLRFVALSCRTKRQTKLFEACALLHADQNASRVAYTEALMRCLHEATGARTKLFAPGSKEMTFDERWLVELGFAIGRADENSITFLLQSRVRPEHQRLTRFLVTKVSEAFQLF